MSIFYKVPVIVLKVLLYGSESWVLTDHIKRKLNSFHNRCARFITGRHITKVDDQWHYPETKQTLELAHVLPVEDYIIKRKNTILDFAYNTNI